MEKVEVKAVIKYLCKKGMTTKEIHEDFMKKLGNESPSYRKKRLQNAGESNEDDERSGRPKDEPPRGKTNNVVSEQVRHKPACTSTEKS